MSDMVKLNPEKELTMDDLKGIDQTSLIYYGYKAWDEMIEEQDAMWCTQEAYSLQDMIPYGRLRFMFMYNEINKQLGGRLEEVYDNIRKQAKIKADSITKEFDMSVTYKELDKTVSYEEIPKVIKRGLFRKETVYEKHERIEYSYKPKTVRFSAWRLAHFEQKYRFNDPKSGYSIYTNYDFCLGGDGEFYHITTSYTDNDSAQKGEDPEYFCKIRKALPFDNNLLENKNQHIFIGISHGLLFVLDAIPIGNNEGYCFNRGNEIESSNFPLRIEQGENPCFKPGEGVLARLNSLT